MDTSSNEGTITEVYDYHLTRDKVSNEIVRSQSDGYVCLWFYALNVAESGKNKKHNL